MAKPPAQGLQSISCNRSLKDTNEGLRYQHREADAGEHYFRRCCGRVQQLVVMSIPVGGEIGKEIDENDQFIRIEQGR